jgi:thiol-disulfide isomerase/thioredoxin
MDHHLEMIAPMHIECKFVKIDAEKCPFFIQKLQVQTLPTLMVFKDGVTEDKLTGFQGLSNDPSDPDVWHTGESHSVSARLLEDEHTRDEVRELATDIMATSICKLTHWFGSFRSCFIQNAHNLASLGAGKLQQWLAMAGCIKYAMPTDEMKDEMKRLGIVERGAIWSENRATCDSDDDDYD